MKKSAFTLIELLVVISIIAILASIAMPVFNKAMEKGKATTCAANLRQLGIGLVAYLNDNEDQMFKKDSGGGGAEVTSWPITLQNKYVTNWKVFRSPFDKQSGARPDRVEAPGIPVSYGINENLFGINASKFESPSQLIAMAPAMLPAKEVIFAETSESNPKVVMPQAAAGGKLGTHNNRSQLNVLYADSHAVSIPYREFASVEDEAGLRRWWPEGKNPEKKDP